jgi:hypothetical protein
LNLSDQAPTKANCSRLIDTDDTVTKETKQNLLSKLQEVQKNAKSVTRSLTRKHVTEFKQGKLDEAKKTMKTCEIAAQVGHRGSYGRPSKLIRDALKEGDRDASVPLARSSTQHESDIDRLTIDDVEIDELEEDDAADESEDIEHSRDEPRAWADLPQNIEIEEAEPTLGEEATTKKARFAFMAYFLHLGQHLQLQTSLSGLTCHLCFVDASVTEEKRAKVWKRVDLDRHLTSPQHSTHRAIVSGA